MNVSKIFYRCMTEGSNIRQKGGEDAFQCVVFTPIKIQQTVRITDTVREELLLHICSSAATDDFKLAEKISRNCFLMFSKQCCGVVERNSYTLKMLDGHIIEVNFFLLHKATRKVFAICQKFVPLGSILKNRMHHIQTFKPLTLFVFL
jgi:hypothetical protein